MKLKSYDNIEHDILSGMNIDGKQYVLVKPAVSQYVNGLLVRYMLCPLNQFIIEDKQDWAEIIVEDESHNSAEEEKS